MTVLELTVECLDEPEPESSHATPDLRILLLEDVELNITVATALLEKLGHTVTPARCGAEALELVNRSRITALIVVDSADRPAGLVHVHDLLAMGVA